MYMLMFSSEVSQIAEFDSDEKNSESQVLSWGGASDYFTVFLSEKGFISKGAIEYSNVYSEVDTSAAHIFSHYLELGGCFHFTCPVQYLLIQNAGMSYVMIIQYISLPER